MRDQEIIGLWEAYQQVHSQLQEVEQLDENVQDAVKGALKSGAEFMKTNPVGKAVSNVIAPVGGGRKTPTATSGGYRKEEVDLFDTILEHLVAEGYADTNESALVIMANMSEKWRESIIEQGDTDAPIDRAKMGIPKYDTRSDRQIRMQEFGDKRLRDAGNRAVSQVKGV